VTTERYELAEFTVHLTGPAHQAFVMQERIVVPMRVAYINHDAITQLMELHRANAGHAPTSLFPHRSRRTVDDASPAAQKRMRKRRAQRLARRATRNSA
jgi:hypothetical protein